MTAAHPQRQRRRSVGPSAPAAALALLLVSAVPSHQWSVPFLPSSSRRTSTPRSPFFPRHRRRTAAAPSPSSSSSACRRTAPRPQSSPSRSSGASSSSSLFGGYGVASNYTWREEQYEIDVTVPVPAGTRAGDVIFRATPKSVDLRLDVAGVGDDDEEERGTTVLLDGSRLMRGRVLVDGTYWALSDAEDGDDGGDGGRLVTVTIEKMIREPADQFEVVEFDWGGVYPDDKDEVREKKYDEAEELDVREYCKELGVDIDNINMSMVDKTMFTSGMNLTRSTLDELSDAGYVKEVTQQDFGKEFVTDKDGAAVPFSPLGENVGDDEVQDALYGGGAGEGPSPVGGGGGGSIRDQLRDLVGGSGGGPANPWKNSMPAEEARLEEGVAADGGGGVDDGIDAASRAKADASMDMVGGQQGEEVAASGSGVDAALLAAENDKETAIDPVDLLTVERLKDILREQGLKVGGNKQELRDRLRAHVGTILEDSPGDSSGVDGDR